MHAYNSTREWSNSIFNSRRHFHGQWSVFIAITSPHVIRIENYRNGYSRKFNFHKIDTWVSKLSRCVYKIFISWILFRGNSAKILLLRHQNRYISPPLNDKVQNFSHFKRLFFWCQKYLLCVVQGSAISITAELSGLETPNSSYKKWLVKE